MLGVPYQTAWFMEHRIREAMRAGKFSPIGGGGTPVEADETFIGRKEGETVSRGYGHKNAILTLVERGRSCRSREELGWATVEVVDDDLGPSGGGVTRPGFERLLAATPRGALAPYSRSKPPGSPATAATGIR